MNRYYLDLHIHSKYSRAVSPSMDLPHLEEVAKKKGIDVVGTGDFTHPVWRKELKSKLKRNNHQKRRPERGRLFRILKEKNRLAHLM